MLARLRDNWVYGGFLAALLLLAVTPVLANGWPLALLLVWLQLPAYMLHQFEEHDDDRFRRFVNAHLGEGREVLTRLDTFVINIVGVWGVDAAAFAMASRGRIGLGLIAVYLSLVNGLVHALQAIAMRRSNPGLFTAVGLFIPLGCATLWIFAGLDEVTAMHHLIGLSASLTLHSAIIARVIGRRRALSP